MKIGIGQLLLIIIIILLIFGNIPKILRDVIATIELFWKERK